jgi:hypothetical protein
MSKEILEVDMEERKERVQNCASRSGEGAIYLKEFVVSLEKSQKEYDPINFLCRNTGQYNIIFTFQDGKAGDAIGIMSHVMK